MRGSPLGSGLMDRTEIEREGWRLGSVTSGLHLRQIVDIYKELGLEVRLEEIAPEECGGCNSCYIADGETIYRVYTRPKGKSSGLEQVE